MLLVTMKCNKFIHKYRNHTFGNKKYPELYLKTQSVPRSKHSVSVIQTSQLMLYSETMAVCSQIHTKHINALCRQNVELLNVKCSVRTAQ